jgi:hypothetical protein
MKPHPRISNTIKWGGLALAVLLSVTWVGSWWFDACVAPNANWAIRVSSGCAHVLPDPDQLNRELNDSRLFHSVALEDAPQITWRPSWDLNDYPPHVTTPLWIPLVIVALASLVAWRTDARVGRRARLILCPKCGYDRTGILQDATCPECGTLPRGG